MKLMKYCLSPNKLAWLRQELGENADGLIAVMDAAGSAYLAQAAQSDTSVAVDALPKLIGPELKLL